MDVLGALIREQPINLDLTLAQWLARNGLAGRALPLVADSDTESMAILQTAARTQARSGLLCAGATAKVGKLLATRGVDALIIKGSATSIVLGESVAARPAADVDVLVAPESLAVVNAVLPEIGARCELRRCWAMQRLLEIELKYVGAGPSIDLHWEVDDTAPWARSRFAEMWSHRQEIEIGQSMSVWTLSPVDTFLVCAIHGTRERWHQMKGVVDAGRLWRMLDAGQRLEMPERARDLNCRVAAATTVQMVNALTSDQPPSRSRAGRLASRSLGGLGARPMTTPGDALDRRMWRWRTSDTLAAALSGAVRAAGRSAFA